MRRLNLGCGKDIREGWDNLDSHNKNGANLIWDLNKLPIEIIKDNTYDYVLVSHVLEDMEDLRKILNEITRITRQGGFIEIRVPGECITWNSTAHKNPINVSRIKDGILGSSGYGKEPLNLSIQETKYYSIKYHKIYSLWCCLVCNLFGWRIVDNTSIKFKYPYINMMVKLIKD